MTCKLAPRPGLIYEKSLDKLLDGAASRVGSQQKPYLDEPLRFGKPIVHNLFLEVTVSVLSTVPEKNVKAICALNRENRSEMVIF